MEGWRIARLVITRRIGSVLLRSSSFEESDLQAEKVKEPADEMPGELLS